MSKIKVLPLISESMGARSLCTFIETPDIKILMDPGVSLGQRWRLLPHPTEYRILMESRHRIAEYAEKSDIVTISHYHFDHCTPTFTDYRWTFSTPETAHQIFHNKLVLAKDYRKKINPTQRRRGWIFRKQMENSFQEFHPADGNSFTFGDTAIQFSNPVFHGESETALGWVVMVSISVENERVLHASDVQGPMITTTCQSILEVNPSLLYLGGPPQYLAGYRVNHQTIMRAQRNLLNLSRMIPTLIVDHHLIRGQDWTRFMHPIRRVAETEAHHVYTAAEYCRQRNQPLESERQKLYEQDPPSTEFLNWSRRSKDQQRTTPPPV
ncbi:MAG: MBL fold metallo-hydrolase [Candidatus Bathyarchaeota archaeon]|nr:MBL fold metallo-hydrolase [Candidatus Bathyarchaeota archaeon]